MSPRMAPEERRVQIIEAAIRVLVDRGIAGFRIREVADVAQVSQPLVSSHFRSRGELIHAAFALSDDRALAAITDQSSGAANGREALRAEMLACLSDDRSDPRVSDAIKLWQELWTHGLTDPELKAAVMERQRVWIQRLAELVRRALEDGSARVDVDPDLTAVALNVVVDGLAPALRWGYVDAATGTELVDQALVDRLGQVS